MDVFLDDHSSLLELIYNLLMHTVAAPPEYNSPTLF